MRILIRKIILALAVLFILVESNAGVDFQSLPEPPVTPPTPAYTMRLRVDQFNVETRTLQRSENPGRKYSYITEHSHYEKKFFYQIQVLDTNLLFGMEEDHGRLVNAYLIPDNIRPHQKRNTKTFIADANGIEFLVHKNHRGTIIGASPPTDIVKRPPWYIRRETQEQVVVHQQPGVVYQQQSVVHQLPGVVHQQPEPVHQQTVVVHQQPDVIYQQPRAVYDQLVIVHQQPGVVYQQPVVFHQQAGVVHQQPSVVHRPPEASTGPHRPQAILGPRKINIGPHQTYQVGIGSHQPSVNKRQRAMFEQH